MNHWADYLIFACFLLVSLGIGLYHGLTGGKQRTTEEFIMANRQLKILPTMLSLIMSYLSAIIIVGSTAEVYSHGLETWPMWVIGYICAILFSERIAVPWLYPLKLTSVNEYFEMRYGDKFIRVFASLTGILSAIMYMGVCMLAPSVALETATGFSTKISIPIMAVVGIVYTAMGGMRAVIWTDVFQSLVMVGGILAVFIKGVVNIGMSEAFDLLAAGNRTNLINFSPDPRVRQTLWGYMFGFSLQWGCVFGLQQAAVQRYSALKSIRDARLVLLTSIPGLALVTSITALVGVVVFAHYAVQNCDPLISGKIKNPNELLPFYVREIFGDSHGFSGLFLATLFSGALSSVSSSLSGCAANAWDDILKGMLPGITGHRAAIVNRILVVIFGLLATGMSVLAYAMSGPVTQIAVGFFGACGGPLLGLYFLSGTPCLRWVRSKAVLLGAIVGLGINLWVTTASGSIQRHDEVKPPISINGCIPTLNNTHIEPPSLEPPKGIEHLYSMSHLWYAPFGCIVTMVLAMIFSGFGILVRRDKAEMLIPDKLFIPFRQIISCDCSSEKSSNDYSEVAVSEKIMDIKLEEIQAKSDIDC